MKKMHVGCPWVLSTIRLTLKTYAIFFFAFKKLLEIFSIFPKPYITIKKIYKHFSKFFSSQDYQKQTNGPQD
jgi:hypothetical protein